MNPTPAYPGPLSIVYVLTNPAMPGIVKIGRTSHLDAKTRIEQLYTTGVPVPFDLEFACKVPNSDEVERALHLAFAPHRVNPRREFFRIEAGQAIAILKLLHVQDATAEVESQQTDLDQQSLDAAVQLKKRRPNLNFEEMQIPLGAVLVCTNGAATVVVTGPKKVLLDEAEVSLSAATRKALGLDYYVAPGPYWNYEGRLLRDIYQETYGEPE